MLGTVRDQSSFSALMPAHLSRRAWMTAAGATVLAAAAYDTASTALRTSSATPSAASRFPDGFVWGTATSAYQVEGAVEDDGRGASLWDVFAREPGRIRD